MKAKLPKILAFLSLAGSIACSTEEQKSQTNFVLDNATNKSMNKLAIVPLTKSESGMIGRTACVYSLPSDFVVDSSNHVSVSALRGIEGVHAAIKHPVKAQDTFTLINRVGALGLKPKEKK